MKSWMFHCQRHFIWQNSCSELIVSIEEMKSKVSCLGLRLRASTVS
jgi:hypothetical protein